MTNGLQARLAASLDKANKTNKKKAAAQAPLSADRKCTKLSISLFDGDIKRLDAIQDYMRERGERISISQAVKLALRTAPLSDALQDALQSVKREDGRKW